MKKSILFIALFTTAIIACKKMDEVTKATSDLIVTSTAFADNDTLPKEYTCDGTSASPPLSWSNVPSGTKSLAITMHHIPGPGDKHVYMVLYNIPAAATSITKNVSGVGLFGINTVNGKTSYSPPCSQGPGAKLYTLTVYALSEEPKFSVPQASVTMDILLSAISKTTLSTGVINVNYSRP